MSRLFLFLLIAFISISAISQQLYIGPPEYEQIKTAIFDDSSPKFYPSLYNRFIQGDTSLTIEDVRYLYYGYTFQSKYIPYQESKYESQMLVYLRKGRLNTAELDEFIKISELKLKELPYDIRTLNILAFSYSQKDNEEISQQYKFKKELLVKAILSTGDGKSEKTAYHVIDPIHERDLLNELGLRFATSNNLANALCDYLVVQPNEQNIMGVYFDISRIMKASAERQKN